MNFEYCDSYRCCFVFGKLKSFFLDDRCPFPFFVSPFLMVFFLLFPFIQLFFEWLIFYLYFIKFQCIKKIINFFKKESKRHATRENVDECVFLLTMIFFQALFLNFRNDFDKNGKTRLYHAVKNRDLTVVRRLLAAGLIWICFVWILILNRTFKKVLIQMLQ